MFNMMDICVMLNISEQNQQIIKLQIKSLGHFLKIYWNMI